MTKLQRNQNRNIFIGSSTCTETGPAPAKPEAKKVTTGVILTLDQRDKDRILRGARNYAASQASDPHALNVAMSHMKSGVSGIHFDEKNHRVDGFYDAKIGVETRTLAETGEKYNVPVYVDVKRA